jgi:outer membrane protein W
MLLILAASLIFAQDVKKPIFYVNTGIVKPMAPEDFHSNWVAGYTLGFGAGTRVTPRLEIRGMFSFNNFTLSDQNYMTSHQLINAYTNLDGGEQEILTVFAEIKALFPTKTTTKVIPYFVAGAGWMDIIHKEINVTQEDPSQDQTIPKFTKNTYGASLGIGFDFPMDEHTVLYLETKFKVGFTPTNSTAILPIKFGVSIH